MKRIVLFLICIFSFSLGYAQSDEPWTNELGGYDKSSRDKEKELKRKEREAKDAEFRFKVLKDANEAWKRNFMKEVNREIPDGLKLCYSKDLLPFKDENDRLKAYNYLISNKIYTIKSTEFIGHPDSVWSDDKKFDNNFITTIIEADGTESKVKTIDILNYMALSVNLFDTNYLNEIYEWIPASYLANSIGSSLDFRSSIKSVSDKLKSEMDKGNITYDAIELGDYFDPTDNENYTKISSEISDGKSIITYRSKRNEIKVINGIVRDIKVIK